MLQDSGSSAFRKGWKKLCTLKDEEQLERALTSIERYKTLLNTWYGQENLDQSKYISLNMVDMRQDVSWTRQSMANLSEVFQEILPVTISESPRGQIWSLQYHQCHRTCPSSRQLLDMIQDQGERGIQNVATSSMLGKQ